MRYIKFRVYDREQKEYSYDRQIFYKSRMLKGLMNLKHTNMILEEATGLRDKNNKQIYEGDLVIYKKKRYEVKHDGISMLCLYKDNTYYSFEKLGYNKNNYEIVGTYNELRDNEVNKGLIKEE